MTDCKDEYRSVEREDSRVSCQNGFYTARVVSPFNSVHQITGFKSREDAIAWVSQTQFLADKYSR